MTKGLIYLLKKVWLLLVLVGMFLDVSPAMAESSESSAVIAALTLNFARFTEWPPQTFGTENQPVKLCVIGDNVIQQAFDEIDQKQAGSRTLDIVHLTRIKNVEQCQLLYLSGNDRSTTIQLLREIKKKPILTIGEDPHFLQDGGMVLLHLVDGKVNIEIDLSLVKEANLQINSRVLKLATIVNP